MIPQFAITADNKDVTSAIKNNLVELTLTDKRNLEADTLDIVLDDTDAKIQMPRRGVELRIWLGYQGEQLFDKGTFVVDACPLSGPPDRLTIQASSANFREDFKIEREKFYDFVNLGWLIKQIATRNGLKPAIEPGLAQIMIEHLDQTTESDANLITELAEKHDALATVKNGYLLFLPIGYTKTVNAISLPTLSLNRREGDSFSFDMADRDSRYTGVAAKWYDTDKARTLKGLVGASGYVKTLKDTYQDEDTAKTHAQSQWNKIRRGASTLSITLAKARLDFAPNHPVKLDGWRKEITDIKWLAGDIAHSLNSSGLTTEINLEESIPDETVDLYESDWVEG